MSGNHPPQVVLVTGVSRYLGAQVAARLAADPRVERVLGLDNREPTGEPAAILGDAVEFVPADLRTGTPTRAIVDERVRTVVHLDIASAADPNAGGRAAMKELNVIGTMQLLAACQQAPGLHKVVFRSSTAAYGVSFRDPAVFTEDTEPRDIPRGGFARDVLDIEGYVRGFARRRPDVAATVLRFAPLIGKGANTSLTRYFSRPLVPTVLGRDPRLQFVHVDDALEILHRSVVEDHPGTFNVAGAGVVMLTQAVRRAGRIGVPIPEAALSALGRGGANFSLDQLDLFVHGRVVDTGRLIREYGVIPRPTPVAFEDFLRGISGVLPREAIGAVEETILAGLRGSRAAVR